MRGKPFRVVIADVTLQRSISCELGALRFWRIADAEPDDRWHLSLLPPDAWDGSDVLLADGTPLCTERVRGAFREPRGGM